MKKLIILLVVSLFAIGLASCSSNSAGPTPGPAPTYTPPPEPAPTYTPKPEPTYSTDDLYVMAIRDQYPYYASLYSDLELINIASSACQYFDEGGTFEELAYYLVMSIDASEDAFGFMGFVIGAGVAAYCPEYSYLLS